MFRMIADGKSENTDAPAKNAVRENRYASNAMPENIYDRLDHFDWTGKRQVLATGLG